MGSKRSVHSVRNENEEKLLVPPGFASLTSLTMKRMDNSNREQTADLMTVGGGFELMLIDAPLSNSDIDRFKDSFNRRPWILHNQFDLAPKKYDSEQRKIDMEHHSRASLPKGVIRGCTSCPDCVNVSARWRPEESCLPVLDEAPEFRPTEEEFKDTLNYISKIRPRAENYGICRIVPPPSWRPPFRLQDIETRKALTFATHVQQINGLKDSYLKRKQSRLDDKKANKRLKVLASMERKSYYKCEADFQETNCCSVSSDFEPGPEHTLLSFKKYADDFKRQYFGMSDEINDPKLKLISAQNQEGPLIARMEGEYWRIIEHPSEEIEVLYGTNLSQTLGSGFPIKIHQENQGNCSEYIESGWNLNNTPKLSGSLLPFGCGNTSTILVPQLFIGMCFASQCWRNEDHHLYSLSYMHEGEPKVWYVIPGKYCFKFVEVVKKLFPQMSKFPRVLHELVYQISPSRLISEGIPVYRCVHNPLEFVIIFPGSYHSGFHCGFNCSEAVCFAPFDWLPHGLNTVEYGVFCRRNSFSCDRLLFGAAIEAVSAQWETFAARNGSWNSQMWKSVSGKEGILTKALKARVRLERIRRNHLCNLSQSRAMDKVDTATERECGICSCDLHLSAVSCSCSPNIYSCMRHVKQLCSCSWTDKCVLFLYAISDLNSLVEALEGNLKAIHYWAKKMIQPARNSYAVKDTSRNPSPGYLSPPAETGELKYPDIDEENKATVRTSSSSLHNFLLHSKPSKNTQQSGSDSVVRSPTIQQDIIILSDDDD